MGNAANVSCRYFEDTAQKTCLTSINTSTKRRELREKVQTPAAFIPDESVHFINFVLQRHV